MSCQVKQNKQNNLNAQERDQNEREITQNNIVRDEINEVQHEDRLHEDEVPPEQIILYEDPAARTSSTESSSASKFKIVACAVIAVLTTLLLASAFFIFAAPQIPALRSRINLSTQKGSEFRNAAQFAPFPDSSTNPKSVSIVEGTSELKWNYFPEPQWFYSFKYEALDEVAVSFAHVIPKDWKVKDIKLTIFIRSINQNPWRDIWTRVRTLNGEDEFSHWVYAAVFPRDTLVMATETFVLPVQKTREIRIKANSKKSNWIDAGFIIEAWRPLN